MKLETENWAPPEDVTEEDLLHILDDDSARGGYVILTSDDGSFLQAAGDGWSPYTMEFFPSKDAARYQQATTELNKDQLKAAFTDFFRKGNAWRTTVRWREVEENPSPRVLVIVGGVILVLVLVYYLLSRGALPK